MYPGQRTDRLPTSVRRDNTGAYRLAFGDNTGAYRLAFGAMPIYEKRTYDVAVGKMAELVEHYSSSGWPALEAGGFDQHLVGYFMSDTGQLHQLVHLWRFDDDTDRRAFWKGLFADEDFMAFAGKIRPLIERQEVQLLNPAPWGPNP
jgi:hypothetical protein